MELINGWQTWWKQWSTWLVSLGTSITMFAPEIVNVWHSLPIEIQTTFPESWVRYFGLFVIISSIPAKLVRQQKLHNIVHGKNADREI